MSQFPGYLNLMLLMLEPTAKLNVTFSKWSIRSSLCGEYVFDLDSGSRYELTRDNGNSRELEESEHLSFFGRVSRIFYLVLISFATHNKQKKNFGNIHFESGDKGVREFSEMNLCKIRAAAKWAHFRVPRRGKQLDDVSFFMFNDYWGIWVRKKWNLIFNKLSTILLSESIVLQVWYLYLLALSSKMSWNLFDGKRCMFP